MNTPITWRHVPGWFDFDDVYQEAVDRAPSSEAHFVEIGVLCGKSALFMAEAIRKSNKKITFDAVDPLALSLGDFNHIVKTYPALCRNITENNLLDMIQQSSSPDVVTHIIELSGLGDFINLVRASGQQQALTYPAESLDFVYVDAQHTYEDTEQILRAYLPKMRRGGVIAGHDYGTVYPGIEKAVLDVLGDKITVKRQSFIWTNQPRPATGPATTTP